MAWKLTTKREGPWVGAWINGFNRRYLIYWWPGNGHFEVWSCLKPTGKGHPVRVDYPYLLMKPAINSDGHPYVGGLKRTDESKTESLVVYKLLYSHFSDVPLPPGQQVRHFNDHPLDLRRCNLKPGTPAENAEDAVRNGRVHRGPKLTPEDHHNIRHEYASGRMNQRELSEKYHRSRKHIQRICTGRRGKRSP